MKTLLKPLVAATTALFIGTGAAHALALSPGDAFGMSYINNGTTVASFNGTVGAGPDLSPFGGALSIDMNAGPNGDGFTITTQNGNYCGWTCAASVEAIVFTGLDFGVPGFLVDNFVDNTDAATTGGIGAILTVLSPSSFSISWTDPDGAIAMFTNGEVTFSGTFVEDTTIAPVPVPAPLALLGFGSLLLLRRRQR